MARRRATSLTTAAPAPRLHRCRVDMAIQSRVLEYSRSLGKGAEVDLDELVGQDAAGHDVRLRDLVRADCFEPVDATPAETTTAAAAAASVDTQESN